MSRNGMVFAASLFETGRRFELQSKSGQLLTRYFPEIVAALAQLKASKFVLDGELVIPGNNELSFDDLLQRIHPDASRVQKLARETPARFIVFDLLGDDGGKAIFRATTAEAAREAGKICSMVFGE